MEETFRERIEQLAKARYGTANTREALNKLQADAGVPEERFWERLAIKSDDWVDNRLASMLGVDREDLYSSRSMLETKRRFRVYLDELKEGHRMGELWPRLKNGFAYRTKDHDPGKPLDDRHFNAFMAEQGLTDYGEWQLELGL